MLVLQWVMPRVPESHLTARREQILDAARRCFSRNGFHATSMQDVIAEAGLSVGAVYRYFKSKDELRTAVAEETARSLLEGVAAIAAHEPPLPLREVFARLLDLLEAMLRGPDPVARVGVQAWGEALRDPGLGRFVSGVLGTMRGHFTTIAGRAQQTGDLAPDADPAAVAAVLVSLVPGYLLQRLHTGGPDRPTFLAGLHALLASP
jgi:AcrR family transcriptional regulator